MGTHPAPMNHTPINHIPDLTARVELPGQMPDIRGDPSLGSNLDGDIDMSMELVSIHSMVISGGLHPMGISITMGEYQVIPNGNIPMGLIG